MSHRPARKFLHVPLRRRRVHSARMVGGQYLQATRQYLLLVLAKFPGQSPTQVAKYCGVAHTTFSRYLNEANPPKTDMSIKTFRKLQEKSGVPLPSALVHGIVKSPAAGKQIQHGAAPASGVIINVVGGDEQMKARLILRALLDGGYSVEDLHAWLADENRLKKELAAAQAAQHPNAG